VTELITKAAMDVAVSIEHDIPARVTGANRVFIRAVIARAITAAVAAEREACADIATAELRNVGMLLSSPPQSSAAWDIRNAIRARSTPC